MSNRFNTQTNVLNTRIFRLLSVMVALLSIPGILSGQQIPLPDGQRLKTLAARHHLLIGGATDLNHNDPNEEAIIKNEYSVLSNENCLKPHAIHPGVDAYNFKQSDKFVAFCRETELPRKRIN